MQERTNDGALDGDTSSLQYPHNLWVAEQEIDQIYGKRVDER